MKPTTFTPTDTDLIFGNILKVPITDFTKGKGFDALFSLPNVSLKHLVEVHSYIFLNDLCKSSDAEHFNNEYEAAMKKIRNPQSDVEKIKEK